MGSLAALQHPVFSQKAGTDPFLIEDSPKVTRTNTKAFGIPNQSMILNF